MVGELLAIRVHSWRGHYAERALEHATWKGEWVSEWALGEGAIAE
jgi:hypothetical protein